MPQNTVVRFLGTRGSVPACGPEFSLYGGDTASVLVHMGGRAIVLDAGSGLCRLTKYLGPKERMVDLLLTHSHLDHMLGVPCCPALFNPEYTVVFHGVTRSGMGVKEQITRLMGPPLWPVTPEVFRAKMRWEEINGSFSLGDVAVSILEANHPGGSTVFRLDYGEDSVVYATDYECTPDHADALVAFAQDCTMLIIDAQYDEPDMPAYRGYGHSTWREALAVARRIDARRVAMFHHAPERTDQELVQFGLTLRALHPGAFFAKADEEVCL